MSKQRQPIETVWTAMVSYNNDRSGASAHGKTFAEFLADLIRTCTYYMTLYPASDVRVKWIEERCAHCDGTGRIQKRRLRQVKCPVCRGKPVISTLEDTKGFRPHGCLHRLTLADCDTPLVRALQMYVDLDDRRRAGCQIDYSQWAECHQAAQEALGANLLGTLQP